MPKDFNIDEFCLDDVLKKFAKGESKKKDKNKKKDKKKKKDKGFKKEDKLVAEVAKDLKKEKKKQEKAEKSGEPFVIQISL